MTDDTRLGAFDFVIVGGGSAGCVLAARLSEDPDSTVLLIEAGGVKGGLFHRMPAGVYRAYLDPRTNWSYRSEPQRHMDDRRIPVPRGKLLGGSSAINSMVYLRGHPLDYDRWAARDFPEWSYAACLPYFRKSETYDRGGNVYRGDNGPLSTERGGLQSAIFDAFLEAGQQAGFPISDDLNGSQPEGFARLDSTKRNGRRCSAADAYLFPAMNRKNLTVITNALAHRVLFSGNRARAVLFGHGGGVKRVEARREVILCGGALNSPHLLKLSGIGPADELRSHGIPVVLDLPGVGENLQDHIDLSMTFSIDRQVSISWLNNPLRKLATGIEWMVRGTGVGASNIYEVGGCVRSNDHVPHANLQFHLAPVMLDQSNGSHVLANGFMLHCSQLRQESRGRLSLASADPQEPIRIQFEFLATDADRREFREGMRMTRDIVRQGAMAGLRPREVSPDPTAVSDAELDAHVRTHAETEFHPSCTCRMGNDPMSVVDASLKVHGLEGLRVVDASVMPDVISANLNGPVIMIAEKAADLIRERSPLPHAVVPPFKSFATVAIPATARPSQTFRTGTASR